MDPKNWLKLFFVTIFGACSTIAMTNYLVDPLFCFREHPGRSRFNDRMQTTNRVYFFPFSCDTLLIGSSRIKNLGDDLEIPNHSIFNYGAAGLKPTEYADYISFAKKQNKQGDFQTILVGLDFNGCANWIDTKNKWKSPQTYISETLDPYCRVKNLVNFDAFLYSTRYLQKMWKKKKPYPEIGEEGADWNLAQIDSYRQMYQNHCYNDAFPITLKQIVAENPNTKVLFFTTPVSKPLLQLLSEAGKLPSYKKWLRDIVDAGGEVMHFMEESSITKNPKYFRDENHVHTKPGRWMLSRLLQEVEEPLPADFGTLLTKDNIEDYLNNL